MPTDYPVTLPNPTAIRHVPKERIATSGLPGKYTPAPLALDYTGNMPIEFFFTRDQANEFYVWWKDVLAQGGKSFNCAWPSMKGGELVARFVRQPVFNHVYDGAYRVSAEVQIRGLAVPVAAGFEVFVDVDAVLNGGNTSANAVAVTGLDPAAVYKIERPSGRLYSGYSAWPSDSSLIPPSTPNDQKWGNAICATKYPGSAVANSDDRSLYTWLDRGYANGEAARAAWTPVYISGSSEYRFWIPDGNSSDNRGGASLRISLAAVPPLARSEAYRQAVLASSPIGYWLLDEVSGTTAAAQVGTAGTIVGTVGYNQTGLISRARGCMKFNGVNGRIHVPQTALDRSSPLTVEAVVMRSIPATGAICSVGPGGWYVRVREDRGLELVRSQIASAALTSFITPHPGVPFHVAVTLASGSPKTWKMYINGVEVGSGTTSASFSGASTFRIGCEISSIGYVDSEFSTHWMQDVAVYDTVLSGASILAHAQAGGFA